MKRRLAMLCALLLLFTTQLTLMVTYAEESATTAEPEESLGSQDLAQNAGDVAGEESGWRDGMSPGKPYAGVPEVDLNEKLGYMILYPSKTRNAHTSCKQLFIYLPREDVQAGDGTFYLATEDDGELWRTAMNNTEAVLQRDLFESEKKSLMWNEGTCFEINLPRSLELGKTYFVNLDRDCVETEDGLLSNPVVGGTDMWRFTLEGDYGVSNMEYRRAVGNSQVEASPETSDVEYEGGILKPHPGDNIHFNLQLGGDATTAVLYGYDDSVDFLTTMYQESGEVTGTVMSDSPVWGVIFLDTHGNELRRIEFN